MWSVDCKGNLLAGILGGFEFNLILNGQGDLHMEPKTSARLQPRGVAGKVIHVIVFVYKLYNQDGPDYLRCPAPPTGLVASVRAGARGPVANGCGAEGGAKFPDLWFLSCCNVHDHCFGM